MTAVFGQLQISNSSLNLTHLYSTSCLNSQRGSRESRLDCWERSWTLALSPLAVLPDSCPKLNPVHVV